MLQKDVVIAERFQTREYPVSQLIQTAHSFQSSIFLVCDSSRANAKSMLGVLALTLWPGMTVTVQTDGPDEREALKAVTNLLAGV
ncbi:HPr family phosphocarrier protein [uncultured Ruthenibacterium sp.]|uniref:HPr family phosphocarrier protein n=1 Tax=uncultured Ruthenibacterium sp. TaxID=1905347 RepID=UPI00349E5CBA